jgi:hypothetical protein
VIEMTSKMTFKECVDGGIITKSIPDKERSIQMLNMAELRKEFWSKKIDDKFIALKIEAYYEIIKELIFANMYKEGYNCTNHLCLISYVNEKLKNINSDKLDELRKIRNEISYRGFAVTSDYLSRNEEEFKAIIEKLKQASK